MAARRLIIVMLVLLGISSVIAVIVPEPERNAAEQDKPAITGTTGATGTTGTTGGTGGTSVPEDAGQTAPAKDPGSESLIEAEVGSSQDDRKVETAPGDRLILTVNPGRNADVEVPGLGLAGTATKFAPVVFDIRLPSKPGRFEVVETGGDSLAEIVSSNGGESSSEGENPAPPSGSKPT